eukprot:3629645-Rhodomonas_salina.4
MVENRHKETEQNPVRGTTSMAISTPSATTGLGHGPGVHWTLKTAKQDTQSSFLQYWQNQPSSHCLG